MDPSVEPALVTSFEQRLLSFQSAISSSKEYDFKNDWPIFMRAIDDKKRDQYGVQPNNTVWFDVPEEVQPQFNKIIRDAASLSFSITTENHVSQILELIDRNPDNILFYWYAICRNFSPTQPQAQEAVFQTISNYIGQIISGGVDEEQNRKKIFSSALALTTFSAKHGAKAFLLGLARANFTDDDSRNATLDFLEREVHPKIYSPLQMTAAALTVYREHLAEEERTRLNSYFDRIFTPSPDKDFTL